MDNPEGEKKNGKLALLTTIAGSGDNMVKMATLALVLLSGLGNFLVTKQGNSATKETTGATRAEVEKVLAQMDKQKEHATGQLDKSQ